MNYSVIEYVLYAYIGSQLLYAGTLSSQDIKVAIKAIFTLYGFIFIALAGLIVANYLGYLDIFQLIRDIVNTYLPKF